MAKVLIFRKDSKGRFENQYHITENWLRNKYLESFLSIHKIAIDIGCSITTVWYWLKKYNIPIRSLSESRRGSLNPFFGRHFSSKQKEAMALSRRKIKASVEELKKLYLEDDLSIQTIADIYSVTPSTVWLTLKHLHIPMRSHSEARKKLWQNPEYRKKIVELVLKGSRKRPSKPENIMLKLIENNNLPFRYVGNGAVVINRSNPDFIHTSDKKVIEVFGDYWHGPLNPKLTSNRTFQGRQELFAKEGYECLIVWEHELENEGEVLTRIKRFGGVVQNGQSINL